MTRLSTDPYAAAYPELFAFWQAAEEGRFLLRYCNECSCSHWYPRSVCPLCSSKDTVWRPACGRATLFAFSQMPHDTDVSGILAYVTLEEGPRMLTRVVDTDASSLRLGQSLLFARMVKLPEGRGVPVFTPLPS